MKGVKRYDENYNPSHFAPAGVYSADNFRENLAELLRVREMTQEEAARRCGVTPPVLNNWLQGRNEPLQLHLPLRRVGDRAQLAAGQA